MSSNAGMTITADRAPIPELLCPITFTPLYFEKVWGGRQMERFRSDLPAGSIGESWDIADHSNGMSVVDDGPLQGRSLRELTDTFGCDLVGPGFAGGEFPLLVKLLDATTRLSVQVHPDDNIARNMGVSERGKTECWLMMGDGGELYVGVRPGIDADAFRRALDEGTVEKTLNRYITRRGDFVFLEATTVHALGTGCLLYEVQQTCDITFRVWDWGRVGLDGKPRELHIDESIATIDFERNDVGPIQPKWGPHPQTGEWRQLVDCPYFTVEERRGTAIIGGDRQSCSIVVNLSGHGELHTRGGIVKLEPARSVLIAAAAGEWHARSHGEALQLLVARPRFATNGLSD